MIYTVYGQLHRVESSESSAGEAEDVKQVFIWLQVLLGRNPGKMKETGDCHKIVDFFENKSRLS